MNERWTEARIPDQSGRTVLITGANSGLGLRSAEVLAAHGARVLLGCRSPERGETALDRVRAAASGANLELVRLDLADLASVREAAAKVRELTGDALDVLMNNAGVMATAQGRTADGFELQFGTNHLGHAALTWLLMPALRGAPAGRVVTLSSVAALGAHLHLDDPNAERRRYRAAAAYGQAKLSNQTFGIELDRRLRAADSTVLSVLAHPGYSATGLTTNMASSYRNPVLRTALREIGELGGMLLAQRVEHGALPQLYAATAPDVEGGDYIGPVFAVRGRPAKVRTLAPARNPEAGTALWELTAELTGVTPDPR
ncbi:SDR family NAD(P)-dependent oxidoreductase [Amycolatopsis rubida]|uniref:SDR family NAD(P)-dependent oxidoreductase n=1 Tax=Amycolatopsis rubida TaxID=112413 RepID=A0ABX0BY93_9PSEU|nr:MULTISPECIES: oxidoreductase [Amycolatopsis]MYW95052.1 SDR family NAD(P)-dependent oxidoreductase [Amycolatopsis rubida]NEC60039.1 SDR family NAD(P)-dependent oxidoreductase [Amycolatopsis rubida]OAP28215.1 Fatty acyl-CoA reductase [Amycolatopsis sp. M39]